jgi:hypothetical protein
MEAVMDAGLKKRFHPTIESEIGLEMCKAFSPKELCPIPKKS